VDEQQVAAEATAESSQETAGSAEAQAQPDPSDFEARLRSDPEFAVSEFKKQQAAASRANDRLRKGSLAIDIAERLGGGDPAKGAEQALTELTQFRQMQQNPDMRALIERWQSGQPITQTADTSSSGYPGLDDDDPREQQLRTMQGRFERVESRLMAREIVDHWNTFRSTPVGSQLTDEEANEVFGRVSAQVRAIQQTPQGRDAIDNLPQTIRLVSLDYLDSSGKLLDLGQRALRQRAEGLQQRETDGPSRSVNGAATQVQRPERPTAQEAWEIAARELSRA
jgi:hypothetical protein